MNKFILMKDHELYIGFIFSSIGIFLGWTLNQLEQWFKARREDKKNFKAVLFNLLEVYVILIRCDIDKYIQVIKKKIEQKVPISEQTDELKLTLHNYLYKIFSENGIPKLLLELKNIEKNYTESIKILATIDPLTAYYLSGKNNFLDNLYKIEEIFEKIVEDFPNEKNDLQIGVNKAMDIVKPRAFNSTLIGLEEDIKKISWAININTWFKSKRVINNIKNSMNSEFDKELDELIEQLFEALGNE